MIRANDKNSELQSPSGFVSEEDSVVPAGGVSHGTACAPRVCHQHPLKHPSPQECLCADTDPGKTTSQLPLVKSTCLILLGSSKDLTLHI